MFSSRQELLLSRISPEMNGIEIAPYHAPLAPKQKGFKSLSIDVLGEEVLRRRAAEDPNINNSAIANIEKVDVNRSACDIETLLSNHPLFGQFDYVISSHNFEHLPDPIRFLQGCSKVLKMGGFLIMAVPDKRACFDYFRPHTQLSEWIEAFLEGREAPRPSQVFSQGTLACSLDDGGRSASTFSIAHDPSKIYTKGDIVKSFEVWKSTLHSKEYNDVHCSIFTPGVLHLLMLETAFLRFHHLRVLNISDSVGCEFFVELINQPGYSVAPDEFPALRTQLLLKIQTEIAANAPDIRRRAIIDCLELLKKEAMGLS